MLSTQKSRRLGTICRIYRNAGDKIIALEDVEVVVDNLQKKDYSFHRSISAIHVQRQLVHMDVPGGSREVAIVQALGTYSSIEDNGGNYLIATWDKSSDRENDVVVSLEGKVAVIGDTV